MAPCAEIKDSPGRASKADGGEESLRDNDEHECPKVYSSLSSGFPAAVRIYFNFFEIYRSPAIPAAGRTVLLLCAIFKDGRTFGGYVNSHKEGFLAPWVAYILVLPNCGGRLLGPTIRCRIEISLLNFH